MDTIVIVSLISLLSLVSLPRPPFHFSCGWQRAEKEWSTKRRVNSASRCTCTLHQGSGPLIAHVPYESRIRAERISAGERADGRTHHFGRIPFPGTVSLSLCPTENETFPKTRSIHSIWAHIGMSRLDICVIWSFPIP